MFALPLFALVCIAGLTMSTDAALIDYENGTDYPWQYWDYANAYDVIEQELDVRLEIRRDGGGDSDFLKFGFLSVNDMVMVTVNQSDPITTVEYWVTDPNYFPVYYYYFTGQPADPNFTFQFGVVVPGTYYIHTGQGFGDTYINMTVERVAVSPPIDDKDSNNAPGHMVQLTQGQTHREKAGLPWDPSDYFYLHIKPSTEFNKYLTIELETDEANTIQWELYDSAGILRPSQVYTSDTIQFGSGTLKDFVITVTGDYIVRIWMREGFGQYNLTMTVLSYENDNDNNIADATPVTDNSYRTGDVNLSFDRDDYYEIYLDEGEPLWVVLTPINGPADLYIFDEDENQEKASRLSGLEVDKIESWKPDDAGYYYIVVESVYEAPDWENPPTVDYTLEVWINYRPEINSGLDGWVKNYHLDEDSVDSDYDVTVIFGDKDGDDLIYELDLTSYNNTLIDIQLGGDNKLTIEPVADASPDVTILLNATDPHGLMISYTAKIWVDPVNDGPYVDEEQVRDNITIGEDLVLSGVNVTRPFRDVDDDFSTWTFTTTTTEHIMVLMDDQNWLVSFTPMETHWAGYENFTVTCTDKGGLTAEIVYLIYMFPINDPPEIIDYIEAITMDEETTVTIDLEDDVAGWYFHDIEEEEMTYDFDKNGSLTVTITGSVVTITGQLDYVGTWSNLVIWAIDDLGAKSENLTVFIQVEDMPDPPEVKNLIDTATVQENEGVTFEQDVYYSFFDQDSDAFDLIWNWYLDGEPVPPEQISDRYNYEYIPAVTAEKDRTVIVRLEVIDGEFMDEASWTVFITNLNAPPADLEVTTAGNKTEYKHGETISFTATATDLDDDTLTYTWFLDLLEEVGTGPDLVLKDVDSGPHKVTVSVKDPSGTETTEDFNFNVAKKDGGEDSTPGFNLLYVALALIGAVVIMAIVSRR